MLRSQGLADAFILMRYPFESEEARQLNIEIFETIYFAALTVSTKKRHSIKFQYCLFFSESHSVHAMQVELTAVWNCSHDTVTSNFYT